MTEFEEYLALYEIDSVYLSIEAHVRYLIIYNAKKGNPIMPENAQKIRKTVYRLTGVPYVGSFVLSEASPPPQHPNKNPGNRYL